MRRSIIYPKQKFIKQVAKISASETTLKRGFSKAHSDKDFDGYKEKLVKLIPAEIVGAYLTLKSILDTSPDIDSVTIIQWVIFAGLLVITPIIYNRIYGVKEFKQLMVTTFAFIIWAFTIGSPLDLFFTDLSGELSPLKGIIASVLLVFYSLITPLLLTPPNNK